MLKVRKEIGWKNGGIVANWGCNCGRVYLNAHISDIPKSCGSCNTVAESLTNLAKDLHDQIQIKAVRKPAIGGIYGVRNALEIYLNTGQLKGIQSSTKWFLKKYCPTWTKTIDDLRANRWDL